MGAHQDQVTLVMVMAALGRRIRASRHDRDSGRALARDDRHAVCLPAHPIADHRRDMLQQPGREPLTSRCRPYLLGHVHDDQIPSSDVLRPSPAYTSPWAGTPRGHRPRAEGNASWTAIARTSSMRPRPIHVTAYRLPHLISLSAGCPVFGTGIAHTPRPPHPAPETGAAGGASPTRHRAPQEAAIAAIRPHPPGRPHEDHPATSPTPPASHSGCLGRTGVAGGAWSICSACRTSAPWVCSAPIPSVIVSRQSARRRAMSPLGGVGGIMVANFAVRAAMVSLTISRAVSCMLLEQSDHLLLGAARTVSTMVSSASFMASCGGFSAPVIGYAPFGQGGHGRHGPCHRGLSLSGPAAPPVPAQAAYGPAPQRLSLAWPLPGP